MRGDRGWNERKGNETKWNKMKWNERKKKAKAASQQHKANPIHNPIQNPQYPIHFCCFLLFSREPNSAACFIKDCRGDCGPAAKKSVGLGDVAPNCPWRMRYTWGRTWKPHASASWPKMISAQKEASIMSLIDSPANNEWFSRQRKTQRWCQLSTRTSRTCSTMSSRGAGMSSVSGILNMSLSTTTVRPTEFQHHAAQSGTRSGGCSAQCHGLSGSVACLFTHAWI